MKNKPKTTPKSLISFPADISALGHNVPVFHNGNISLYDGTSASTPFFAGMVTLLNDIRLAQNKPSLGFINPMLYSLDSSYFNGIYPYLLPPLPPQRPSSRGWSLFSIGPTNLAYFIFSRLLSNLFSSPYRYNERK
jgi:hypothetical protein